MKTIQATIWTDYHSKQYQRIDIPDNGERNPYPNVIMLSLADGRTQVYRQKNESTYNEYVPVTFYIRKIF